MYRIGQNEIDAVARVIQSKKLFKINNGDLQETANFEKEMREKLKIDRVVLMTSGMASLISALVGMGIGPGDEVIVPAYTYIATAIAVVNVGAVPVIAEIDESLMIDPVDVEKKITNRTKAIIPVHMQGHPCNMDAIMTIAKKHNIFVLEDACQAVGGSYGGKRLGTIGDAGAYSFNYFKIISAGEGGAMMTNNKEIFEKGLIHHDSCAIAYFGDQMQGFEAETFCGTEYRTNEITAAILREQLKRLDGILEDLRRNKKLLIEKLAPYFSFVPLNDEAGDCATSVILKFDTVEEAESFATKLSTSCIINTGKHVYNDWAPILEKKGAAHPLMNPFNFEENSFAPEYKKDMCPRSLELLARHVIVPVDPEWTEADIDEKAKELISKLD